MMVTFVSQCEKKALNRTRRVLDAFADRIGDNTWQTVITQEGIQAVKKLLRKTATKNTAVSCHWMRSRSRSELVWIIGNRRAFNESGCVPVNRTRADGWQSVGEGQWSALPVISLASSIAALFHDVGKANKLFQKKLKSGAILQEPFRHEWVSLRIFESLVADAQTDEQWLHRLAHISPEDEQKILADMHCDPVVSSNSTHSLAAIRLESMPPLARLVAWLVLTHHRLPVQQKKRTGMQIKSLDHIDYFWKRLISSEWNSPQCRDEQGRWNKTQIKQVWQCAGSTPFLSNLWCNKVHYVAKQALNSASLTHYKSLITQRFIAHISRLSLMLADHVYSSQTGTGKWSDSKFKIIANTHRSTGEKNQYLDEHLIGVYRNSLQSNRTLPFLKRSLPALGTLKDLDRNTTDSRFSWQNKAYSVAKELKEKSETHGFFGVNVASTGKGKTLANLRIMYGLDDSIDGLRVSIALGLRTLTLQTGEALRDRLNLGDDELAVLVGSSAVTRLFNLNSGSTQPEADQEQQYSMLGSESSEDLLEEDQEIFYEGNTVGPLAKWLKNKGKLNKLVNAPILVSTIDHLMPATEAARGGKQIAPMLRLLSSDLILDEPDDFSNEDLPALCRLVNWAGLLGSKVLLSSATLTPSQVSALYQAYGEGRRDYQTACASSDQLNVPCAWFDEFQSTKVFPVTTEEYEKAHQTFIDKRLAKLQQQAAKRKLQWIAVEEEKLSKKQAAQLYAKQIYEHIEKLTTTEYETHPETGQKVSLGLVRFANIDPMIVVTRHLLTMSSPNDWCIHYCVYHSRLLLVVRSNLESMLDAVFDRNQPESLWQQDSIQQALNEQPDKHHVFVVLGSPVMEVGRDWSAHWAIAEPSAMRSLIQLAGRIRRHQNHQADQPNIYVFNKNIRACIGEVVAYTKPGAESQNMHLEEKNLMSSTEPSQISPLDAKPRIKERDELMPAKNWVDLEHVQLKHSLFLASGNKQAAELWWTKTADLTAEYQRRTPFRQSSPQIDYFASIESEQDEITMYAWEKNQLVKKDLSQFEKVVTPQLATGIQLWFTGDYQKQITQLATKLDRDLTGACKTFGAVSLDALGNDQTWSVNPLFGFYRKW